MPRRHERAAVTTVDGASGTASDLACLVVSLPDAHERRAAIGTALAALGVAFELVDARPAASVADDPRVARAPGAGISDAEYACALSHRLALERFLDGSATHALILEDDALIRPGLARYLAEGHYRRVPMCLLFHSRARVRRRGAVALCDGTLARPLALSCTGAVAFTLDRACARRLRDAQDPVRRLADWPLDLAELGAHVAEPMLVGHPERVGGQSTLAEHRAAQRRPSDPWRVLRPGYARRRWRKATSVRIS